MKKWSLLFFFAAFVLCGLISRDCLAQQAEQEKINYLLNAVGSSDLKFVREGEVYDGKDAEAHLRHKLYFAGNRIKTAQQFIDYIATKSSVTGRPYYVILGDGTKMESKKWLEQKLEDMKK